MRIFWLLLISIIASGSDGTEMQMPNFLFKGSDVGKINEELNAIAYGYWFGKDYHQVKFYLRYALLEKLDLNKMTKCPEGDTKEDKKINIEINEAKGFIVNKGPLIYMSDDVTLGTVSLNYVNFDLYDESIQRVNFQFGGFAIFNAYFKIAKKAEESAAMFDQFRPFFQFKSERVRFGTTVRFGEPVNPILFNGASVRYVELYGATNSSLKRLVPEFTTDDNLLDLVQEKINIYFDFYIFMKTYNIKLTKQVLNKHILKYNYVLAFNGHVQGVQVV